MANDKKHYEITELIDLMKANKILKLEVGPIKLELHPDSFGSQPVPSDPKDLQDLLAPNDYSADQLLYWSSGEESHENV